MLACFRKVLVEMVGVESRAIEEVDWLDLEDGAGREWRDGWQRGAGRSKSEWQAA